MAGPSHRTFKSGVAAGVIAGLSFAFALASSRPALAAGSDCPATPAAFAVDGVRPADTTANSGKSLRILAIGSSSTEGIGATAPSYTYPAQLQTRLAAMLGRPVEVDNSGVGGETIGATVKRLEAALAAGKPDLVIWQVGTNDAVTDEDEGAFRGRLIEGVAAMRAAKVPFVLIDPQYYPGVRDVAHYEQYVRIIRDVGAESGAAVFSRYALMKEWGAQSDALLKTMLSKDFLPHERPRLWMLGPGSGCRSGAEVAPASHGCDRDLADRGNGRQVGWAIPHSRKRRSVTL